MVSGATWRKGVLFGCSQPAAWVGEGGGASAGGQLEEVLGGQEGNSVQHTLCSWVCRATQRLALLCVFRSTSMLANLISLTGKFPCNQHAPHLMAVVAPTPGLTGDNFTHKRGGIPDLSHLDQMAQVAQSGQQPGNPPSAKEQMKTGGISKTAA